MNRDEGVSLLATTERVRGLTDEVNQLHPVLYDLFHVMPDVKHVEHTHGPNEKGADFIIHRFDETLQKIIYIGVIVKAQSIKQDHDDVERQIKECMMPRHGINGDLIQFQQIWIISSQNITQNAKEKIWHEYAGRSIEFIPDQRLAELIHKFLPSRFTRIPPVFQALATDLQANIESESKRGTLSFAGDNYYVEPELIPVAYDSYNSGRPKRLKSITLDKLLSEINQTPCLLIEAPMGGGKSKLGRELVKRILLGESFESGNVFPYLLHARDFVKSHNGDVSSLVQFVRDKYNIPINSKAIIVIDGFDELDLDTTARGELLSGIYACCSSSDKKPSVILLSRPLEDSGELAPRLRSLSIIRIEQMKGSRGLQLLARAAGNVSITSKIIEDVRDSPLFIALEGTPIAFLLLGRLLSENANDLPSNLTELFQKYTELVLGRWEIDKGLRNQIEYEVLTEVLTTLAVFLLDNSVEETTLQHLRDMITNYVKPRRLPVDPEKLIAQVTGRHSVLFIKPNNAISFRHRAFCEFFYARKMKSNGQILMTAKVFDPYWSNSYFFAVGLHKDAPAFLEEMGKYEVSTERDIVAKCLNVGQFLLAGYLTPREVARKALFSVFNDMAQLYLDAIVPNSNYRLAQFPPLQLLGALNGVMRRQYGYTHFRDELEEAIYDAEAEELSHKNSICLLFLDTAYREAGGTLRFDALLDKYGDGLALLVKLAVTHESMRMRDFSDRIRRMERNLRRTIKANRLHGENLLTRLYETPMKAINKPVI